MSTSRTFQSQVRMSERQNVGTLEVKMSERLPVNLPLADLLHSVLQLVSLEEDDEDGLVDLVPL